MNADAERFKERLAAVRDTSKGDAVMETAMRVLPALKAVARSLGYALGVHGSLSRDIDVIAAPWVPTAVDAPTLAAALRDELERVTGKTAFWMDDPSATPGDYTRRNPQARPHGRLAWAIHVAGLGTYVDLSVLPTDVATAASAKAAQLAREDALRDTTDATTKETDGHR